MYGKELRREIRARAAAALPIFLRVFPEDWGREFCAGLGWVGFRAVGRDRRLARGNLARVYPEWPAGRIERTARAVFEEIGRNAYDFLRYPDLSPARRQALVELEGREHLDGALASGRGAVVVTAHLGCWEVLAGALAARGYPLKALAQPLREPRLEKLLRRHRARMGIETLSSMDSPLAAVRHVQQGGFLGVLMDQRMKRGGVTVNFLGQSTRMTDAPARLALAAGAPLLPVGISRGADHRHRARALPAVETASLVSAPALTQALADALGALIRETPEQWMWIHPRWMDAPAGSPSAAANAAGEEAACGAR